MIAPLLSHFTRILTVSLFALCVVGGTASFSRAYAENSRDVIAQASERTAPTDAPAAEHEHDTPAVTPALPNLNPHINKKRVAFWGVIFMASTSVAFVVFGVWAMRRAPKPGQQRPG
jgi:hypothetical protein